MQVTGQKRPEGKTTTRL